MTFTVIDGLKKYWPTRKIRYDMLDLIFTKLDVELLVVHMMENGATRGEIDSVYEDYNRNYA